MTVQSQIRTQPNNATADAAPAEAPATRAAAPATTPSLAATRGVTATGLVGIAAIHLADLPSKISEVPYLGWAYIGLIAASLLLAALVVDRFRPSQLLASAGLALAVIAGFVINRTVGMPSATDDIGNWSEPLGMVSLLVEAAVVWFAAAGWLRNRAAAA